MWLPRASNLSPSSDSWFHLRSVPLVAVKQDLVLSQNFWHVKIESNSINGLTKTSAIDTLQLRGVDLQRFIRKLGSISEIEMLEVAAAIATVIDFI